MSIPFFTNDEQECDHFSTEQSQIPALNINFQAFTEWYMMNWQFKDQIDTNKSTPSRGWQLMKQERSNFPPGRQWRRPLSNYYLYLSSRSQTSSDTVEYMDSQII